jgi:hypothetical protein
MTRLCLSCLATVFAFLDATSGGTHAQTEDSPVILSEHSQADMFALVYEYAFGSPHSSKEMTCTAVGPTDAIGNLPADVVAELNARIPPDGADWLGFVDFSPCFEIEKNNGVLNGEKRTFTRMIDTGPPDIDTGHSDVHMFNLRRYCGEGCGSFDWMTVYVEPEGYVLIWGYPRLGAGGEITYEAQD